MKQIDILDNDYGVKHINIHDELFVFNPRHYLPIAEVLIERGYDLNINAFARVDVLAKADTENLMTLKKAGFHWLKLGIETGNTHIRANVGKVSYNIDVVRKAVNKSQGVGIDFCANFMFVFPVMTTCKIRSTCNRIDACLPKLFFMQWLSLVHNYMKKH